MFDDNIKGPNDNTRIYIIHDFSDNVGMLTKMGNYSNKLK